MIHRTYLVNTINAPDCEHVDSFETEHHSALERGIGSVGSGQTGANKKKKKKKKIGKTFLKKLEW